MALPSGAYAPREPAESVLYQIVRDHYETFRIEAACLRDGEGLPRFVEEEFQGVPAEWVAGRRVRAVALHALPRGAAGGVLIARGAGSVPRVVAGA